MAELDALVSIPGFSAELDIVVGRAVSKAMSQPMSREDRMRLWRSLGAPIGKRINVSGTVTAAQAGLSTATAYFEFAERPQVGRLFSVRRVALTASSPPVNQAAFTATAISNLTASLFATPGGYALGPGVQAPPIDSAQTAFTLPNTQFYSAHQLSVRGGDRLVVGIQGTAVVQGFQVFGNASIVEIDDSPEFLMTL